MQTLVARLIDCGIPRETALAICRYYRMTGGLKALEKYVEEVEAETHGKVADVE